MERPFLGTIFAIRPPGDGYLHVLLKARIVDPIVRAAQQGLSPERVAMTIAVGFCLAIIPVIGVTTILLFLAAWALRLNQPIIQLINWSSAALQLLLIIPFIRLGEAIFRRAPHDSSLEELVATAKSDPSARWRCSVRRWATRLSPG